MELTKYETPAVVRYDGSRVFDLSAGNRMQFRDNESGEIVEFLDETVPQGKKWSVQIVVSATETDA